MKINKSKFQTAVHLGLLIIIFVLLCVNFRSNLTIYHAGVTKRKAVTVELNKAALSVSRTVQKEALDHFTEMQRQELEQKYGLNDLILVSDEPSRIITNPQERLLRIACDSIVARTGEIDEGALKSFGPRQLARGESNEYYYLYPLFGGARMLVLAKDAPDLAYLEDSSETLIIINIVAVLLIVVLYLLVFRVILSPFRKIRRQAVDAGRELSDDFDDVEGMVEDYQNIIDELKEKEAQLLQLNQRIQAKADRLELFNQYLLRSISSGIIIVDADGRILSVNDAASRMIGIDPELFAGRSYHELPSYCAPVFETVRDMLDTGKTQAYRECDMVVAEDRNLSLGVTVSSIHDYTSHRVGVSVLVNDLTEIKGLRNEVETRNRLAALGEMASGLAHQLRNSIGAMAGYAHLVKKRLLESNLKTDSITALEDEAREAERLVGRFLSFARPFDFTVEDADVGEMIGDIVETFRVRPENQHIRFQVSSELPPGVFAKIDSLLIKQAIANLIENAINAYGGEPGRVELATSSHSDTLVITIRDFGCGISPENVDKIFTPFYSSRPSGTGLGLPLARKILDLHQGRLTVASEPGKGTLFTVFLPLDCTSSASALGLKAARSV